MPHDPIPTCSSTLYSYDLTRCPACGADIEQPNDVTFVPINGTAQIAYALCIPCGLHFKRGLGTSAQRALQSVLEVYLIRTTLMQKEVGYGKP